MMNYRMIVRIFPRAKKDFDIITTTSGPEEMADTFPGTIIDGLRKTLEPADVIYGFDVVESTIDMVHNHRLTANIGHAMRMMCECWNMQLPDEPVRRAAESRLHTANLGSYMYYAPSAVYTRNMVKEDQGTIIRRYSDIPQMSTIMREFEMPYDVLEDPLKALIQAAAYERKGTRHSTHWIRIPSFHPMLSMELGKYYMVARSYIIECLVDFVLTVADMTTEPEDHLRCFHEGLNDLIERCHEVDAMPYTERLKNLEALHSPWHEAAVEIMVRRLKLPLNMREMVW